MDIVLDTVSLQHVLKGIKSEIKNGVEKYITVLDDPLCKNKIKLIMDEDGGLEDEWSRTCGREYIKVYVSKWNNYILLKKNRSLPKIEQNHRKKLREYGAKLGTVDTLILKLGLSTDDKIVVSIDSDFWNPKDKSDKSENAPVKKYCLRSMSIKILSLEGLLLVCKSN